MWFSWFRVLTARLFYFSLVEGWVKLGNNRTRVMFKGTETALLFENCSCYIMVTKPRPPPTCPFHRKTRQQSSTSISHLKKNRQRNVRVFHASLTILYVTFHHVSLILYHFLLIFCYFFSVSLFICIFTTIQSTHFAQPFFLLHAGIYMNSNVFSAYHLQCPLHADWLRPLCGKCNLGPNR